MEGKQEKVLKKRKMKKQNKPQSGSKWHSIQYFDETRYRITSEVMAYPRMPRKPKTPTVLEILRDIEEMEEKHGHFLETVSYVYNSDTDTETDSETAELGAVGPPVASDDLENQTQNSASSSSCNDTDAEKKEK